MPSVYRKTAKGRDEVATRASRLPPRLRSALILVDGQRDDAALAGLLQPDSDERLQALLAGGFIEAVAVALAPAPPKATAAAPAPARAPAPAPAATDFKAHRREAVFQLTELLGPHADDLALRMEDAKSQAALQPLIGAACRRIELMRGKEAARAYGERFGSAG